MGLVHPVKEILGKLGVEVAQVCPHQLTDKATYLEKPYLQDMYFVDPEASAKLIDPWDGFDYPPHLRQFQGARWHETETEDEDTHRPADCACIRERNKKNYGAC